MKVDEGAMKAARHAYDNDGKGLVECIETYLAALSAEPEIEGGVRVRVLVGVDEQNFAWWEGSTRADDGYQRQAIDRSKRVGWQHNVQIVEATLKPYAPPAEPVVEGRVVVE